MRRQTRARPRLERLEMRSCPSTTASVTNGLLMVIDDQSIVNVTETAPNTFEVQDGNGFDQTFPGVTSNVDVLGTTGNQTVVFNLMGNTAAGDINVLFNHPGANNLRVINGSINGSLNVGSGPGDDTYLLGDGINSLVIHRNVTMYAGNGSHGNVELIRRTSVDQNLSIYYSAKVSLDLITHVGGNVLINGSVSGGSAALNGSVGHDVSYIGTAQSDAVTTGNTAVIGGSMRVVGNGGTDAVTLGGRMTALYVDTGAGADVVNDNATVQTRAMFALGINNPTLNITGTVGSPGSNDGFLYVSGGSGSDTVTVASTAEVNGLGLILLGSRPDKFVLQQRADQFAAHVVGGPAGNTFIGNKSQLKFLPMNF
jgi:hypothetical protein